MNRTVIYICYKNKEFEIRNKNTDDWNVNFKQMYEDYCSKTKIININDKSYIELISRMNEYISGDDYNIQILALLDISNNHKTINNPDAICNQSEINKIKETFIHSYESHAWFHNPEIGKKETVYINPSYIDEVNRYNYLQILEDKISKLQHEKKFIEDEKEEIEEELNSIKEDYILTKEKLNEIENIINNKEKIAEHILEKHKDKIELLEQEYENKDKELKKIYYEHKEIIQERINDLDYKEQLKQKEYESIKEDCERKINDLQIHISQKEKDKMNLNKRNFCEMFESFYNECNIKQRGGFRFLRNLIEKYDNERI